MPKIIPRNIAKLDNIPDVNAGSPSDNDALTWDNATGKWIPEAAGAAGASIELDNLGVVAINTSLISDTDSTDDLGSLSVFWRELFVDQITIFSGRGQNLITIEADSATNDPLLFKYNAANPRFRFQNNTNDFFEINPGTSTIGLIAAGVTSVSINLTFRPSTDSAYDSGNSSFFWDETFTDELVLSNVGAASAAANTIRLSAVDLSAGNTILDINTEGTDVVGTGTPVADRTVAIRVNGTVLYLIASTVAS